MDKPQKNWIARHKFLSFGIFICTILVLLLSLKSVLAAYFLNDFFKQHASDIDIEELTLNFYGSDFTIKGFNTRHVNGQQLNIGSLYVDWQFEGLFDNQITINEFKLDGVRLDIESDEFVPVQIGPLLLSKFATNEAPSSENQTPSEPWSINLKDIELTNLSICLDDATVLYKELGMPLTQDEATLGICLLTDSISIAGEISLDKAQQLTYQDDIEITGLAIATAQNETLVKFDVLRLDDMAFASQQLTIDETTLQNLTVLAEATTDKHTDYGVTIAKLATSNLQTALNGSMIGFSNTTISDLTLRGRASDDEIRVLTQLNSFSVADFSFNDGKLELGQMKLAEGKFLENFLDPDQTEAFLLTLSSFDMTSLNFDNENLAIDTIGVNDLQGLVTLSDQGANMARWLPVPVPEETSATEDKEHQDAAQPLKAIINSITLKPGSIRIIETLTEQTIEHSVSAIDLQINNINTGAEPDTDPADISLTMTIGEDATFTSEGVFKLMPDNPEVDVKGSLSAMDMVPVSHLATRFIGYRIDRGLLNVDYEVGIKEQKIDANLKALLEKFALAALEENEKSPLNEDLGLPLPMALNLLRDGDDNIELDLPISGDLNSPDFSAGSIVSTVMVKAIKNAVIFNYSPLGMLTMASGILDLATALRFEPVVFEPRQVAIPEQANEQLAKIIQLMQEKPKVKMIICGVATETDKPEQLPVQVVPTEPTATNSEATPPPPATQPVFDPMTLIALAKQRQEAVINYIVNTGSIERARLIGCNVKLAKKKDAKPVVEISI